MKISIGCDHVAVEIKNGIINYLECKDIDVIDRGTYSEKRVDYTDYANLVVKDVQDDIADKGILICGSGIGMSIAANKYKGIRCVCCSEPYSAKLSREHNDTNVLAFGSRVVGVELAKMIVDAYLGADFKGGRHQVRIDKIRELEG